MNNKKNYTGKIVYMGIDIHKKTYCCVSICEGEIVKRDTLLANPEGLLNYMNKFFPGAKIKSAYEAGFAGFHLHRALVKNKIHNIVVHPASIEVSSRDRVKTDKRDALKIATQLSVNRLRGIYVPSFEQEGRRTISRLRSNFMKSRTRVGAQFKSLLFTQGLIEAGHTTVISQKWITQKLIEIEKGSYPEDFYYSAKEYAEEWKHLTGKIKEIEERLKTQAEGDKDIQRIYESVPGIGLIHGRQLANELGDMSQFHNEKQLFSYTGLTPSELSSGEHIRQGHISRQGRSVLRNILIEASWTAIRKDPELRKVYENISRRRGGKRAIVGVARRLVGRIRACLKSGLCYGIEKNKKKEENNDVDNMIDKSIIQEKSIIHAAICATSF
jgi:transposase